jgi:PTH1 family peptidyl-tRNA hydrolase
MRLWVGLGNPEPRMRLNRHNIGFMALEAIAARHPFSGWRNRFAGRLAEGTLSGVHILLLEPLTYMNASGESVAAAARFYRLGAEAITVFHDDLDLAPGKVRERVVGHVLGNFTEAEMAWLTPLLAALAEAAPLLAAGRTDLFMNRLARPAEQM